MMNLRTAATQGQKLSDNDRKKKAEDLMKKLVGGRMWLFIDGDYIKDHPGRPSLYVPVCVYSSRAGRRQLLWIFIHGCFQMYTWSFCQIRLGPIIWRPCQSLSLRNSPCWWLLCGQSLIIQRRIWFGLMTRGSWVGREGSACKLQLDASLLYLGGC